MADTLFTVGRTSGLRARTVRYDGGRLTLTGYVLPSTDPANGVLAARQQLHGLVDNIDETVFPVICSTNPTLDGYYTVSSVSVDDLGVFNGTKARFSLTLDRVDPDATGVLIEGVGTVFTRTNGSSVTGVTSSQASSVVSPCGQWSAPLAATQVLPPNGWGRNIAAVTRVADSGSVITAFIATSTSTAIAQYLAPVANYYDGSACIERLYGSTYHKMQGRQASLSASNWRLTNGLIRIQASSVANRLFDIYSYNGSAWSTSPVTINIGIRNQLVTDSSLISATNVKVEGVSVLRNTVEACTLRLVCRYTTINPGGSVGQSSINNLTYSTFTIDVSLRRGDHMATVNAVSTPGRYIKCFDDAIPASTSLTGGMRTTSNIANGNSDRLVIATTGTLTHDGTSGIQVDGTSRADGTRSGLFAVGLEIGGSGATGQNAAQELIYQFLVPFAETQRVVLR